MSPTGFGPFGRDAQRSQRRHTVTVQNSIFYQDERIGTYDHRSVRAGHPALAYGVSEMRDSKNSASAADKQDILICILQES